MSDIDIMLRPEVAATLLSKKLDVAKHYTFERTFAPGLVDRKTHVNTFLVQRAAFWQVNGYDIDLTPAGGGGYGGDSQFLQQLRVLAPREHLQDVVLVGYGRRGNEGKPVIADADTNDLDRVAWHEKFKAALERKEKSGDMRSVNPIRVGYERVL